MDTLNLSKDKVFRIIGIIVMLIGIVIAFCSEEIELIDSIILDGDTGIVPVGITLHVIVILIFMIVSAFLLYYANKVCSEEIFSEEQNLIFHALYIVIGLFFSIATGCSERSNQLSKYYEDIHTRPSWYIQDMIDMPGFDNIPEVAEDLSNVAMIFYILAIIGIISLVFYCIKNVEGIKNKIFT